MNSLAAAFAAEKIKLRRTLAKYLSIIGPIAAVVFSAFMFVYIKAMAVEKGISNWQVYISTAFHFWASFLLPVMVTLQAVLMAQIEHANHQWKHLLALPVPRSRFYMAKLGSLMGLSLLATIFVAVLMLMVAGISGWLSEPGEFAQASVYAITQGFYCWAASLFLIALQLFISIALPSFTASISIGLIATIACLVSAKQIGIAADLIPWSMPAQIIDASLMHTGGILASSLAGTLGVTALGIWHLKRHQEA